VIETSVPLLGTGDAELPDTRRHTPLDSCNHEISVVIPTLNEARNVAELIARLQEALVGVDAQLIFVDDSTDSTATAILFAQTTTTLPVRLIRRPQPTGQLAGAVIEGIAAARSRWVVVMDGDLQHPPEDVPRLLACASNDGIDLIVATRYLGDGPVVGLANRYRRIVSAACTAGVSFLFRERLRDCTDPMTGFFVLRRDAISISSLRPSGFKVLLEILVRNELRIAEVPFSFAPRRAGASKASFWEGLRFLGQVARLRLQHPRSPKA